VLNRVISVGHPVPGIQRIYTELFLTTLISPITQTGFLYFSCFLKTMRREWFGIDRLRLDKYLMLIRKFIAQMFRHLSGSKW